MGRWRVRQALGRTQMCGLRVFLGVTGIDLCNLRNDRRIFQKSSFVHIWDGFGAGFGISAKKDAESSGQIVISSIFQKLTIFVNCVAH